MKSKKIQRLLVLLLVIVLCVGMSGCKRRNKSDREDKETTESNDVKGDDDSKDDKDDDKKTSDDEDDGNKSFGTDDDNIDKDIDKDKNTDDDNKPVDTGKDDNTGKDDDVNKPSENDDDNGNIEEKEIPKIKSRIYTTYYSNSEEKMIYNYDEYGLLTEMINNNGEKAVVGYTFDTHNYPAMLSVEADDEKYVFGITNVYDGDELTEVLLTSVTVGDEFLDLSEAVEQDQIDVSDFSSSFFDNILRYYNLKNITFKCPYNGDEIRFVDNVQVYMKSSYSDMIIENEAIPNVDGSQDNITTYWNVVDGKTVLSQRYVMTTDDKKRLIKIFEESKDPEVSVTLYIGYSEKSFDAETNEYCEEGRVIKWESSNPGENGGTGISNMDTYLDKVIFKNFYSGEDQTKLIRQVRDTGEPYITYYSESGKTIRNEQYYDGRILLSYDYEYWE